MGIADSTVVMETSHQTQTYTSQTLSCTHTQQPPGVRKERQGELCLDERRAHVKFWQQHNGRPGLEWPHFTLVCVWESKRNTVWPWSLKTPFLTSLEDPSPCFLSLSPLTMFVQPSNHTDRRTALCVASATMHAQKDPPSIDPCRINTRCMFSHLHTCACVNSQTHTSFSSFVSCVCGA